MADRHNIVHILLDDSPWDLDTVLDAPLNTLGFLKLPNLYMDIPVCAPARASLLTGRTCATHGVTDNQVAVNTDHAGLDEMLLLPTAIKRSGARTALIGKYENGYSWTNEFGRNSAWKPYGWDVWKAFRTNNGSGAYLDYNLAENGVVVPYGSADADYSTDVLAGYAVDFIETAPTTLPWYVHLAPYAPHDVAIPPTRYASSPFTATHSPNWNEADVSDKPSFIQADFPLLDSATTDLYDAEHIEALRSSLAVVDMIEDVVAALDARGVLGNTIVMVTSDNHTMFGEHRLRAKPYVYEECVRGSGAWVLWPGVAARTETGLVTNTDLAPTIAANFGVPLLAKPYGQNIAPLIKGETSAWRSHVLTQRIGVGQPNRNYKAVVKSEGGQLAWKYVHYYESGVDEFELYDLASDPYELANVAGTGLAIEAEMEARLVAALAHA